MRLKSKTYWLIPLLILAATSLLLAKNVNVASPWVGQPPVLDGQTNDWPDQSSTFLKDKDVLVRVCNDSQNVYVMLGFRNAQWAGIIKRSGLTIKIDPQGKNKDAFTLKFVDGPSLEQIRELRGKDSTKSEQEMGQMPPGMEEGPGIGGRMGNRDMKMEKAFICSKKGYLIDKPIPTDGSQGPGVGFGLEKGFFAYEFKIPLGESSVRYYALGARPGQKISIGFVWGEIDKGKTGGGRPSLGEDEGGPPSGGGGGMPGSGKGGRGGGGHGGKSGMPEKQEIWLKAQLSLPEGVQGK